ncbi:hypothetical protein V6Z11_A02G206300 [Gossypium hirsutum]
MVTSVPNKVGNYSSTGNGVHKLFFDDITNFLRRCLFRVLSVGPIPTHLAFIMDGNRGIENFKRRPDEVQSLMDLMLEKMEVLLMEESIVNQYGIRVCFIGNLRLLSEPVRVAAEKVMKVTSNNSKAMLFVCVAYTASNEIVHAVEGSCKEKGKEFRLCNLNNEAMDDVKEGEKINGMEDPVIKLVDIEKHMYMAVAPDPDMLIRSSGESRLSNFLLWQTCNCQLYSPAALWPEIGLSQLVWAILKFQQSHSYLEKKKKQL